MYALKKRVYHPSHHGSIPHLSGLDQLRTKRKVRDKNITLGM